MQKILQINYQHQKVVKWKITPVISPLLGLVKILFLSFEDFSNWRQTPNNECPAYLATHPHPSAIASVITILTKFLIEILQPSFQKSGKVFTKRQRYETPKSTGSQEQTLSASTVSWGKTCLNESYYFGRKYYLRDLIINI